MESEKPKSNSLTVRPKRAERGIHSLCFEKASLMLELEKTKDKERKLHRMSRIGAFRTNQNLNTTTSAIMLVDDTIELQKSLFLPKLSESLPRRSVGLTESTSIEIGRVSKTLALFDSKPSSEPEVTSLDTNVWLEGPDSPNNFLPATESPNPFNVKAANLNKLIERLTWPGYAEYEQDYESFVKTFLSTFRSFASPQEVLKKIKQRFDGKPPKTNRNQLAAKKLEFVSEEEKKVILQQKELENQRLQQDEKDLQQIRELVCHILEYWFTKHFQDYRSNAQQMESIKQFVDMLSNSGASYPSARALLKAVNKKISMGSYQSLFGDGRVPADPPMSKLPKNLDDIKFEELDDEEIARQITITDSHTYAEIEPLELQNQAWSKEHLKYRSPNVLEFINRFNRLSTIVASAIVQKRKIKTRVKTIEKWLRITQFLRSMNNFNAVMAIMAGMNSSAVFRLKLSFAEVNKGKCAKLLKEFQELVSSEASYKQFRELIKTIKNPFVSPFFNKSPEEASKPRDKDTPCIPFLGVYLTDLTFVEDGNPDTVGEHKLVNFRKRRLEYDVISQVLKFQSVGYDFKLVPKISQFIYSLPLLSEADQYQFSLQIEPRGAKRKDVS